MREHHLIIGIVDGVVPIVGSNSSRWRLRVVMSLGGKGSVGCHRQAIHRQRSSAKVRPVKFGSPKVDLACERSPRWHTKKRGFNHERRAPHGEKPLHSIYDRVQCSAGPHRCDTLIVVREIVPPDVHWFALRRQQLLRDLALGRRQRGGYRSEALL
jgi:hypothetical protein